MVTSTISTNAHKRAEEIQSLFDITRDFFAKDEITEQEFHSICKYLQDGYPYSAKDELERVLATNIAKDLATQTLQHHYDNTLVCDPTMY
jgi:hypothetical protein